MIWKAWKETPSLQSLPIMFAWSNTSTIVLTQITSNHTSWKILSCRNILSPNIPESEAKTSLRHTRAVWLTSDRWVRILSNNSIQEEMRTIRVSECDRAQRLSATISPYQTWTQIWCISREIRGRHRWTKVWTMVGPWANIDYLNSFKWFLFSFVLFLLLELVDPE